MIIYNLTVSINKDIEDVWLKWMIDEHIKDVMKTGYFMDWEMHKQIIPELTGDKSTFIINYKSPSLNQYNEYMKNEAPRLQKEHSEKFFGKFQASRSVYQLIL